MLYYTISSILYARLNHTILQRSSCFCVEPEVLEMDRRPLRVQAIVRDSHDIFARGHVYDLAKQRQLPDRSAPDGLNNYHNIMVPFS